MSKVQKIGQVIAIAALSFGPVMGALAWIGHVINDSDSVAGTLAVNSVVILVAGFLFLGVLLVVVALLAFWVWVFGVAWESDEARGRAADVE